MGRALRDGTVRGEAGAAALSAVQGSIESHAVEPDEVELLAARVGIGWYGEEDQPAAANGELMVSGQARTQR